MSYMVATCPDCGARYDLGVVGATMIGGHECPALVLRDPVKASISASGMDPKEIEELRTAFGDPTLRPVSPERFHAIFGDLPRDGEG